MWPKIASLRASLRVVAHVWDRSLCVPSSLRVLSTHCSSSIHCHRTYSTNAVSTTGTAEEELVPERLYTRINIKVKGSDYMVLDSYCRFAITAAKALGIDISGRVALPTRIQKFTVLKSPHIYKKHRVQYEIRTHGRLMQVKKITGTTADIFLEYIQRNLPEGVSMSVYQKELSTLPALLVAPPEGEERKKETAPRPRRR